MRVFIFFLILTVVAGLVAAGGDRMGHLAARRKIRFGKMRPRHVSTLIAVVSGMLIALVTTLILFALDNNVREALTQYDSVKGRLVTAQHELSQAQGDAERALADTQAAEDDRAAAVAELASLQDELSDTRGTLFEAGKELDIALLDLEQAKGDVAQLNARKVKLEKDIAGYESVEANLRQLIAQMRDKIESLESGAVVIPRDTVLYYQTITPADSAELESRLSGAMMRLGDRLAEDGLSLDPAMPEAVASFIAAYPYAAADHDVVVVFRTLSNVLENSAVRLNLSAVALTPLVKQDDQVMTVLIEDRLATVSWLGQPVGDIAIPAEFDADTFADFTTELWRLFTDEAAQMGFLPNLSTGEIATPINSLINVVDDLVDRQRPFIIQFVARDSAQALEGLADCEIYISKWPPER